MKKIELKKDATYSINIKGKLLLMDQPLVMGILNITTDSFFDGGKYILDDNIKDQIEKMIAEGVDIIDIGAQSSRPGASLIAAEEEIKKLEKAMSICVNQFPEIPISVDTFHSKTAEWSIEKGAAMINDISAGDMDSEMFESIRKMQVPYIFMHMQGNPATMQIAPNYEDVCQEVLQNLAKKAEKLNLLGINDIIADPGFGFGKTLMHNYELLANLERFHWLEIPILVGFSRKSMINKVLDIKAAEALNGTTVLNTIAIQKGAHILRVHDVKEAKEAIKLCVQLKEAEQLSN